MPKKGKFDVLNKHELSIFKTSRIQKTFDKHPFLRIEKEYALEKIKQG